MFLTALLIIQPFDISMVPRRMWLHHVTIHWLLASLGLAGISLLVFRHVMKSLPDTPQELYVSDRLKTALDAHGIGAKMGFKRCHVVDAG